MAQISARLVKDLRDKTGAGMMNCKKALAETGGDLDSAVDWLRKNGLAAAAKKAGRVAAEGLVGAAVDGPRGAMVEINAETDFVGRNEEFQAFVASVVEIALASPGGADALAATKMPDGATVEETLTGLIARIGENMSLRRSAILAVEKGVIGSYVHNSVAPELGPDRRSGRAGNGRCRRPLDGVRPTIGDACRGGESAMDRRRGHRSGGA